MRQSIIIITLFLLISCNTGNQSKEDAYSILQNLLLSIVRGNRVTVSGTAVKGIVKNANVTVSQLTKEGTCDTSKILVTGTTDLNGSYSLKYNKTGGFICITISGSPDETTKVYDEKLKSDIAVSSGSNFNITSIVHENKFIQNSRKSLTASPFSNMLAKRFQYLVKELGSTTNASQLYKKASKEIVIRFGLNTGFSATKSSSTNLRNVSEDVFPELDDIPIDLSQPSDPNTIKFITLMTGFSQLANQYKSGSVVSTNDISSIINAFATDFEDGVFDGKGLDFKSISIGSGSNQAAFTTTPLTSILLPAVVSYIQQGGSLSVGANSVAPPPVITSSQVTSQIQFVDNTPIVAAIINPVLRRPFPVSDTGQVKCFWDNSGTWTEDIPCSQTYTEGSSTHPKGQDPHYANIPLARSFIGPTAHQTFTSNYTTLDDVTGLVWKTCVEGRLDSSICTSGTQTIMDYATAISTCNAYNSINGGAGYAGKTNWHLPTIQELSTIHNFNFVQTPQISPANFPGHVAASDHWSSTTNLLNTANAWVVTSNGTPSGSFVKTNNTTFKVRCVSGNLTSTQSFTDASNGTVVDNHTGLIWQKCAKGLSGDSCASGTLDSTNTWVGAISYCEGLTLAGRSDWRLPNVNELKSTVDYSVSTPPTIKIPNFPNPPSGFQWSSTSFIGGSPPASAYYINFNAGETSISNRGVGMAVRCVTGP